jgi:hypothetical protein
MDKTNKMTASNERLTFRMQVGAAVVLDIMITKNAQQSSLSKIAAQLNEDDFQNIVKWSLNKDASLRVPAARILANTADIPTLRLTVAEAQKSRDDDVLYNTAWILRQSGQRYRSDPAKLKEVKQLALQLRLDSPGPKTNVFLDQIDAL